MDPQIPKQNTQSESVAVPPTTVPEKPKSNNKIIALFSILVILLIGSTGFLFYQNMNLQKQIISLKATPPLSASPSATPDPTANWKTYNSSDYSFKYPVDWSLTEQTDTTNKKTGNILLSSPTTSETVGGYPFDVIITNTNLSTVSDYIQSLIAQTPAGQPESLSSYTQTQIIVGGQPAVMLASVFAGDSSKNQIYVLFNGKVYEITFPVGQDNPNIENAVGNYTIANQILSTFKFTQ